MKYVIRVSFIFALIFSYWPVVVFAQANKQQLDSLYQEGQLFIDKLDVLEDADSIIFYLQKALPYFQKSNHWDDYVGCLNWIASAHYNNGDFAAGRAVADEAQQVALKHLGEDQPEYRDALSILAVLYDVDGGYDQSIHLNRKVIALSKKYGGKESDLWNVYLNLGFTYKVLGDYDQALFYFQRAKAVWQDLAEYAEVYDYASILYNLAECFQKKEQWAPAAVNYHQSLRLLAGLNTHSEYIDQIVMDSYNGLAAIYLEQQQGDSVLYYTQKAIQLQTKGHTLARSHFSYVLQSRWYSQQVKFTDALEVMGKAKTMVAKTFNSYEKHPEIAEVERQIANTYYRKKAYQKALEYYQQALWMNSIAQRTASLSLENFQPEQFINPLVGLDILEGIASTYYAQYLQDNTNQVALQGAHHTHLLITQLIVSIRQDYLADGSKNELAKKVLPIYEQAIEVALVLFERSEDRQYLEAAFSIAECNKAILLYENQKESLALQTAHIPDSLLQQEINLRFELNQYKKKITEARQKKRITDRDRIKEWEAHYFECSESYRQLIERFEKFYPEYYKFKFADQSVKVKDIQQQLPSTDAAFLEFMVGEKQVYAFLITDHDLQVFRLTTRDSLVLLVNEFRKYIAQPPESERYAQDFYRFGALANHLFELLIEPVIAAIDKKKNRLIIVPDDVLCYLPFETLLASFSTEIAPGYSLQSLDYLLEKYSISYHYSAFLFLSPAFINEGKNEIPFLGMAPSFNGPDLVASRSCELRELYTLQCNENEVRSIQKLWKGQAIIGSQANKSSFYQLAPKSSIIHLATHACIDPTNAELNRIFFSDEYLSGFDLSGLNLHADLVVLSACNTGVGTLVKGEGIMSLTRGFFLAGCKSVLTTLWAVDDCATSTLMKGYHQNLLAGKEKDVALQQAKLSFLNHTDKVNMHPYYWAPFVQFGDLQTLQGPTPIYSWKYLGFLFVSLLSIGLFVWGRKEVKGT